MRHLQRSSWCTKNTFMFADGMFKQDTLRCRTTPHRMPRFLLHLRVCRAALSMAGALVAQGAV